VNDQGADIGSIESAVSVPVASVRISPHGYFTVFLLATFFAAFLFYLEMDVAVTAPWAVCG
jgi:hypothetical protein